MTRRLKLFFVNYRFHNETRTHQAKVESFSASPASIAQWKRDNVSHVVVTDSAGKTVYQWENMESKMAASKKGAKKGGKKSAKKSGGKKLTKAEQIAKEKNHVPLPILEKRLAKLERVVANRRKAGG